MNIQYSLIAESFNSNLAKEDITLQEQLSNFLEVLEMLAVDETLQYPLELYDQVITKNQSLADWLYSDGKLRDEKKLFQLMLRKMQMVDKTDILTTIDQLQSKEYDQASALLTFYSWDISDVDSRLLVQTTENCYETRRFYLHHVDDASTFLDYSESCFPQLYINKRVYQTLKRMKPFRDYIEEIILHLTALNDHAPSLFIQFQDQNETVVLKHLEIIGNIFCSIQGDPAYEKANLCFEFPTDEGDIISIVCAPHTKLFNKYSNERIYFHWGHPDVHKGEKLLIGHIGDHL
ncbi:hypothetical protein AB9M62_23265 [Bacillales bacterium AN1005]